MREILFRGKRTDNGKWIEGGIYTDENQTYIIHTYRYIPDTRDWDTVEFYENHPRYKIGYVAVEPESIGEFTGLTDKNGTRIFEGDIVKTQPFYDRPYSDKRKSKQFIGTVEYKIKTFNGSSVYPKQDYQAEWGLKFYEDFGKYVHSFWSDLWNCEVIGNIHDNPELLKEPENV